MLLVTQAPVPGAVVGELQTTEVDLFIGRNYVVTIHRGGVPGLESALVPGPAAGRCSVRA